MGNDTAEYMSPEELRKKHGCPVSKNSLYTAINSGQVPHIRIGRRILVPADALDQMLAAQTLKDEGER